MTLNNNKYTIKTIKKSEIYIKNNLKSNLNNIKGVVFDCDGVLIDARLSYDLAIKNTISLILGNFISSGNIRPELLTDISKKVLILFGGSGLELFILTL